jgi:hypothetical protein
MIKRLKYSKIELKERTGALMIVNFLDDDANMYEWCPKWAEVEQVFLKQINVERHNKPESEFLNRFASTAQSVVEGAQQIDSAFKIFGQLTEYQNQKLVFQVSGTTQKMSVTPGFDVTISFLDKWLNQYDVEVFTVNDVVFRLRHFRQDENGNVDCEEYPAIETKDEPPF